MEINDPWFENLYYKEFGANATKFIEEIKMLLIDREKVLAPMRGEHLPKIVIWIW